MQGVPLKLVAAGPIDRPMGMTSHGRTKAVVVVEIAASGNGRWEARAEHMSNGHAGIDAEGHCSPGAAAHEALTMVMASCPPAGSRPFVSKRSAAGAFIVIVALACLSFGVGSESDASVLVNAFAGLGLVLGTGLIATADDKQVLHGKTAGVVTWAVLLIALAFTALLLKLEPDTRPFAGTLAGTLGTIALTRLLAGQRRPRRRG